MSDAQKLYLENLIFAQAVVSGAPVEAVRGGLASPSTDGKLQLLLFYYNIFFRQAYAPEFLSQEPYETFRKTTRSRAIFKYAGMGICEGDILSELWYEEHR
jgi:hypothetical protein